MDTVDDNMSDDRYLICAVFNIIDLLLLVVIIILCLRPQVAHTMIIRIFIMTYEVIEQYERSNTVQFMI